MSNSIILKYLKYQQGRFCSISKQNNKCLISNKSKYLRVIIIGLRLKMNKNAHIEIKSILSKELLETLPVI